MLLALTYYEQQTCPGCGQLLFNSTGDHMVDGYEVAVDTVCHGCAAMESYRDDPNKEQYPGLHPYVREAVDDDS